MKKYLKWLIGFLFLTSLLAILFFYSAPILLSDTSFSRAVYDENHRLLRLTLSQDDKYRLFTPLSQISPQIIATTLLQEDQYFYWHVGVNPLSLCKAVWQTFFVKSRRIGASTITMQVARIRFGMNSKTLSGKIWQMLRAIQLEMHYSKNQLLEAYLNLAPYGNNIEGVGAASLIYFNKPAKQITLQEALILSVIPQNPAQRSPLRQKNLKEIRNKLFARWLEKHPEDKNKPSFVDLPLQIQTIRHLPFLAPHFVNALLLDTPPTQQAIVSTLDVNLQKTLEDVTRRYLAHKKNIGVHNAAVLLIDTRDMGVKALVGSADFFNQRIGGQMNGTSIKRSPGSALKPFIYGLALDQGLIHPNTVLKDVPRSFGSYNPENFDYDFMGPIKARDALVLSRNIPAIYLADQLANPSLYQFLQIAGIKNLKPEAYYGLAVVLGGAELTMQELTSLYAMLANDGIWHPLRTRKDQTRLPGKRLLSPEASFLVLDMLKDSSSLEPSYLVSNKNKFSIAWKTGTSSGYRDAWSIGVVGPYVLAVWVGNFDNSSNAAFVGKKIAGPLLFELADAMHHYLGHIPITEKKPAHLNLINTPVCKVSGMLPTRYCEDTELTWFIPGKSPIKTDTIHREVAIDKKTGLRLCQFDQNAQFEVYEFWPSDLLKIFKRAGIQRRTPPAYDASCKDVLQRTTAIVGMDPQITSPQAQLGYVIHTDATQKSLIPFTATADADVTTLYWFLNETFLAKTRRDQAFWWRHPRPGKFIVRVVDDHGRADARDLVVH